MDEITLLEIKNAYQFLTNMLAITHELTKASSNIETTVAVVQKLGIDASKYRDYYATLNASIKTCRDNLRDELVGIASTFSDSESKVFIKWLFEGKSNKEIADELNMDLDYIKHLSASVKKRASLIANNLGERDIMEKLLKDVRTLVDDCHKKSDN